MILFVWQAKDNHIHFPSSDIDQIADLIDHIYMDYHHEGLPCTVWLTLWHSDDDTLLYSYKLC